MGALRDIVRQRGSLALLLIGVALLARIAIPAGFMPVASGHGFTVLLCTGHGPARMDLSVPVVSEDRTDEGKKGGRTDAPCAFSSLTSHAMPGADPALLAAAVLFLLALGFRETPFRSLARPGRIRPPLRAPPQVR